MMTMMIDNDDDVDDFIYQEMDFIVVGTQTMMDSQTKLWTAQIGGNIDAYSGIQYFQELLSELTNMANCMIQIFQRCIIFLIYLWSFILILWLHLQSVSKGQLYRQTQFRPGGQHLRLRGYKFTICWWNILKSYKRYNLIVVRRTTMATGLGMNATGIRTTMEFSSRKIRKNVPLWVLSSLLLSSQTEMS